MAKITLKPLDKNDPLFKQGFITYKNKNHKVKNKTNKKSKIIDQKIRKEIKR